jgi:hypothetical protein
MLAKWEKLTNLMAQMADTFAETMAMASFESMKV